MPEQCNGKGPPLWQVTGAVDAMSTTIVFDGVRVPLREAAVTATVGHFAKPRLGWSIGAGGIVGGSIDGRAISGGATLAGGISWLPVFENPRRPFVGLSATAGTALAWATADDGSRRRWSAWDLRLGVMTGKTLGPVTVYAAARVFGGPVFWFRDGARAIGTDRWHVTAGAGAIARLPRRLDLSVEVMPLGEQGVTGALTLHW